MTTLPIYTALNVPTVTSKPSANCVQWSADGQVCFVTKNAVYVMTPDHGINFDNSSAIKSSPGKDNQESNALGWFRTIIPIDKSTAFRWPEYSQDWAAASLGSIDVTLNAVALSPTNVSPEAGSILATLTSNMDLSLWASTKNSLKGEWGKMLDITPLLVKTCESNAIEIDMTARVLACQVTSITWTPQADFGISPSPNLDSSFLLAGTRSGCLHFLRYHKNQTIEFMGPYSVADDWITHIAFSSWTLVCEKTCEGQIAFGTAGGAIGIMKVTQNLQENTSAISFCQEFHVEVIFKSAEILMLYDADKSGITALRWVILLDRSPLLVHCKPGVIHLWRNPTLTIGWSGHRSLVFMTHKTSTSSSALHPASGVHYIKHKDALVVTLLDGSFHIVHNLSTDPSWLSNDTTLSQTARSIFVKTEQGDVDRNDANRISGAASYDNSSTFLWLHESSRPADFSYKHDAKHNSTFVVAQMWDAEDDEAFMHTLSELLDNTKTASGLSPLQVLRPALLRLRDGKKLNLLLPRILTVLHPHYEDYSVNITIPTLRTSLTPELRSSFRNSLTRHLFGWDTLLSLRMRLFIADFSWKISETQQNQLQCGEVAQILLNSISHIILRTIIRHLVAVIDALTPSDIPFVLRVVGQSLLPDFSTDISQEGQHLSSMTGEGVFKRLSSSFAEFTELCPACHVKVPLTDITSAVCQNGHTWMRCSITTFILSTPSVRTCIGCSRKALLPLSASVNQNQLPTDAQGSWVVEDLLEAVHRCLFCNNSFVRIL